MKEEDSSNSSKAYMLECRNRECRRRGHFKRFRISIAREFEFVEEKGKEGKVEVYKTFMEQKIGKRLKIAVVKCNKCHSSNHIHIVKREGENR